MTGPWPEGRRDGADSLGQLLHEEVRWLGIGPGQLVDGPSLLRVRDPVGMEEGQGVRANGLADDELEAGEADTLAGKERVLESDLGIAQIDHHLGPGHLELL